MNWYDEEDLAVEFLQKDMKKDRLEAWSSKYKEQDEVILSDDRITDTDGYNDYGFITEPLF